MRCVHPICVWLACLALLVGELLLGNKTTRH